MRRRAGRRPSGVADPARWGGGRGGEVQAAAGVAREAAASEPSPFSIQIGIDGGVEERRAGVGSGLGHGGERGGR